MDLTFFPGSLPIHEKPPNRSFSNREYAFSLSLPIFRFLNFYKTAGDGGVGRAGISGRGVWGGCDPPGGGVWTPVAGVNRHFPNKERMICIIYAGRFHARNLPGLLHSQSLFFSLKKKSPSGEFFFSAAIETLLDLTFFL